MGESRVMVEELLALCLQRINMEENSVNTELEFVAVVRNFETTRKKWLHAELELKKYKELLVKSDVAKAALEVKLKHARNQLDVEMKKRYKIEADYQYLVRRRRRRRQDHTFTLMMLLLLLLLLLLLFQQRQMQLMCDILVHDSKSSACLNDEQKSLLATFEHKTGNVTLHRSNKRLSVIDESSFLSHSDISYDRTDDDVDLDSTAIKPLRSRARERRRSSMGPVLSVPVVKRGRGSNVSSELMERKTVEKEVETVVKALVTTPDTGGQIHMVLGITQETTENPPRTFTQECALSVGGADQTSVWFPDDETMAEPETDAMTTEPSVLVRPVVTCRVEKNPKHVFVSKTVIRPETCLPCGKRIRFGRMAVKCRSCRAVAHPECKHKFIGDCSSAAGGTGHMTQDLLESFAPPTHPRVPRLIIECVSEIERRGLDE
ncbi:rac GTPase-activating protein 1-like, partial [Solea senegalensis]